MSTTYDIVCIECKVRLWIGQSGCIYTGEPYTMRALQDFFYDHQDHELRFWSEHYDEMFESDWKAIDPNDYKETCTHTYHGNKEPFFRDTPCDYCGKAKENQEECLHPNACMHDPALNRAFCFDCQSIVESTKYR